MKKVSKKVVKETTKEKSLKVTTTVFESKCGCDDFECIHKLVEDKGFTKTGDAYTLSDNRTITKGGKQITLNAKLTITPIKQDGENHNIIRTERVISEEVTNVKKGTQSDIVSILDNIMQNKQPTANDINELMKAVLTGGKLPSNVKVMAVGRHNTPFPTFQEFVEMLRKSE